MSPEEFEASKAAMAAIAPIFDRLEAAINQRRPVGMLEAYFIALAAVQEVDMEKAMLERFVAVLMADRTHHGVGDAAGQGVE